MEETKTESAFEDFWGKPISVYTRAQAIADGVLRDVSETAKEAGFRIPVAVTSAVWIDCCEWSEGDTRAKGCFGQSTKGRLWDVLTMLLLAVTIDGNRERVIYKLRRRPRAGCGPSQIVTLKAECHGGDNAEPVITIMFPAED